MKVISNESKTMLTLYHLPSCPFCQRVVDFAEKLNIQLELKDISDDEVIEAELVEKGGKLQVPYLIDVEKNISMYDSNDIIEHLRENYINTVNTPTKRPRVHVGGATCESCEG
jgi:glutaredoxin